MMATDNRQPASDRTASPWRSSSPPTQLEIIEEELIGRVLRGTDGAPGPIAAAQQALSGEEESSSDGLGDISKKRCHSLSSSMRRMGSNRSLAVYLKSGEEEQEGGWRTRTLPNMPHHDARNPDAQPAAPERQTCTPKSQKPNPPGLCMDNGLLYIPRRQSSRAQASLGPPSQSLDEHAATNRNSIFRSPLASQPEIITITPDNERGKEELTTQVRRRSYVDASLRSAIRPNMSVRNSLDDDDSSGTDRKSTPSPANAVRLTLEPTPRSNHIRATSHSSVSSNMSRTTALPSTVRGTGARPQSRSLHDYDHHRYSLDLGHPSPLRSAPVHIIPGSNQRTGPIQPMGRRPNSLYGDSPEHALMNGTYLADAPHIHQQPTAQSIASGNVGASRLPDFFSRQVFQIALHNPATAHHLLKFSETRLCSENVEFLFKVRGSKLACCVCLCLLILYIPTG